MLSSAPVVEDALGDAEESGGLLRAGLAGAEPMLLALLAAHWSVPDREARNRKPLPRRQC